MKAISLLQPWASLVAMGAKQYETRSWKTTYRGKLLIHASARFPNDAKKLCDRHPFHLFVPIWRELPLGAIIGMVDLVSVHHVEDVPIETLGPEGSFGDYAPGRFAWKLKKPVLFETPIPCAGALSIWDAEDRVLKSGPESVKLFSEMNQKHSLCRS